MDKPIELLEFETMLLGRHSTLLSARRRGNDEGQLDRSAYVLLSRIQMDGPMSISQLSSAFGLDASTLNRQTAAMLRDGLVDRIADPEGGIARKFRITAEGEHRLTSDRAFNTDALEQVVGQWEPGEVEAFTIALNRFNRDIERLEGRPWPRP
nr:MarR family transcriptional regulator [Streptomyces sp. NBC_00830]